ncbi:hypothetical protein [Flavobacterium sp. 3HN19-14]|uniref:hypothetical protein n=1 Tax=Flavobacterium sp. 3HN19-14 TaxID=3448133 RepID=UPI003EDE8CB1
MYKNYKPLSSGKSAWLRKDIVGSPPVCSVRKQMVLMAAFVLMLFAFTGQSAFAQANNYSYSASTGNALVTITSPVVLTTVSSGSVDDGSNIISPAGFTFAYNGTNYTQFGMSTNGWIQFGSGTPTTARPTAINGFAANAAVAFERDANLNTANGGSMTHGPATGGLYVFQFVNNSGGSGGGASATAYITMQIVLWGSTSATPGRIDFIYGSRLGSPATAGVIGITDPANTFVNGVDGSKVSATATSSNWPAAGTMYTFLPPPPCNGTPVVRTCYTYSCYCLYRIDTGFHCYRRYVGSFKFSLPMGNIGRWINRMDKCFHRLRSYNKSIHYSSLCKWNSVLQNEKYLYCDRGFRLFECRFHKRACISYNPGFWNCGNKCNHNKHHSYMDDW